MQKEVEVKLVSLVDRFYEMQRGRRHAGVVGGWGWVGMPSRSIAHGSCSFVAAAGRGDGTPPHTDACMGRKTCEGIPVSIAQW